MKYLAIAIILYSPIPFTDFLNSYQTLQDKYPKMKHSYFKVIDRETKKTVFENREICALIDHESARTWNPSIESYAGAVGLMQIMPYHPVKDRTDPEQNLTWGINHLQTRCIPNAKGSKLLSYAFYHGGEHRKFLRKVDQQYVIAIIKRLES
jgi:soluble lytic murein transglycosylase-like protein